MSNDYSGDQSDDRSADRATDHPGDEDLVMLYYRETALLERGKPDELRAHLETCASCQKTYQTLVKVLETCDDLPVPEPHLAFESRMWNRLEPQLHPLKHSMLPAFGERISPFAFFRTRWFVVAAAAAMLMVAFFAGRLTRPNRAPVAAVVAITPDGRLRVLQVALSDHLERSEMMLTDIANLPQQPAEVTADLIAERERARNLISENRLYRQTAALTADPTLTQVLDDLERVLIDISHGVDSREIKERIDSESLLFKLRVLGSNLNRTTSSTQPPTQETL